MFSTCFNNSYDAFSHYVEYVFLQYCLFYLQFMSFYILKKSLYNSILVIFDAYFLNSFIWRKLSFHCLKLDISTWRRYYFVILVSKIQIPVGQIEIPYSFYLWNLAPENVHGAQHFKSCCFLGQPNNLAFK